jgi:ABC-2 type transport system permease protein
MIAAILRAQWLSMRFGTRGRAVGVLVALIWYGLWVMAASVAWVSIAEADAAKLRLYLPLGMLGVFLYWQLMPVASASMGSALDLRKLLAYPIPHGKLFAVEVLLRLTTAIEMLIVMAGGAVGLAANPVVTAWGAVLSLPLFIAVNLLLASGMRSVLARRRVREVVVLLMTMLWVLPRLLMSMGYEGSGLARLALAMQSVALPWTAAAHAATGQSIVIAILSLCGWVVVAGWFGRRQFERSLRYDATAAQATPDRAGSRRGLAERFFRLPGAVLRDPLAGIVEKELRSLSRTPRFRMVFAMGFTFGLAVWFPLIATGNTDGPRVGSGWFLTVVCVYALTLLGQVSYWNCFGFDRSATAFYFAAPLSITQVLAGKNIAALIYIYLEVLMVIAVTVALGLSSGFGSAVETIIVMGICGSYMLALGNLASVRYPRGLSGERVAHGGGRGFQGFLFLVYPFALMPVGLAYLARYAFENDVVFGVVLAISGVIGGVFYWIALESAVKSAGRERERIIQELSQSDGPVVRD